MPYFDPSRPMPDSFTPPNGATSVEMMPVLMPTMPYSSASATRQTRRDVAAVEIRGEAELGVVGERDRLLGLGRESEQRRDRAERFLARDQPSPASRPSASVGSKNRPPRACRLPPTSDARALRHGVRDVALDFLDGRDRR